VDNVLKSDKVLVTNKNARAMDAEAPADWGLDSFALVEAAGRTCAAVFAEKFLNDGKDAARHGNAAERKTFTVLAGSGNNAADALVMLKALILGGYAEAPDCQVFVTRLPADNKNPLSMAVTAIRKMRVPITEWDTQKAADALCETDYIIDGITGTGLDGPLRNTALETVKTVNLIKNEVNGPLVVSVDVPSGIFDDWQEGMPVISADATLAIEPQKLCLYAPAARPHAGTILPVNGIFPQALLEKYREAELVTWENAAAAIPAIPKTAHKYGRGLAEIRAGSQGATGAAKLAALGAQAAGAGLVRLIVDPSIYPVIAPGCSGVMAVPDLPAEDGRFTPDAVLLGPGWGKSEDRIRILEKCLSLEEQGTPLILDADAIALSKGMVFHGNAVMTPHVGEFAAWSGLQKDEILSRPIDALRGFSEKAKAVILLKSHVMYVASPDGRVGIIDGMNPVLATGGTGDVLAGFCAAIAARWKPCASGSGASGSGASGSGALKSGASNFDAYACARAAGALLIEAAKSVAGKFADPSETARAAASLAGAAWLEIK